MGKVLAWVLGFTKVGKVADPVQKFISGKGSYLSGAALMIPALIVMIQKFGDQGLGYFATLTSTQEWIAFCGGLAVIRLRSAITKGANPLKDPNYPNQGQ